MAPVVQIPTTSTNKTTSEKDKPKKPTERRPELFCRVKYTNTLPDIPFDPKFIVYPFDTNRFVEYKQTSLEKNYKHDLLTEPDLGVTIDLINPETYEINEYKNVRLAEEDEKLLEDEVAAPQDTKRSRCHNRAITWLKKTEYISTEFNRYGASSDKTETKVGFGVKKKLRDENFYLDRDSQILAINKTFESAKKPILSHPGKPGLKPVKILPVFPDFNAWKYPFAQVMFDADPLPMEREKEMAQAMIRGVMDESGDQFVAYCLPTEDCMNKRKIDELEGRDYTENEEYEYTVTREYNWNVKNKGAKNYEENYFFVWRDDAVCYNEIEARVKLSKRRTKQNLANSKLLIKHRPLNEQESKIQEIRMTQLEPPQEEEDAQMDNANTGLRKDDNINENNDNEDDDNDDDDDNDNDNDDDNDDDDEDEQGSDNEQQSEKSDQEAESSESESDNVVNNTRKQAKNKKSNEIENSSSQSSSSAEESSSSESEEEEKNSESNSGNENDSDAKEIFGSDSD